MNDRSKLARLGSLYQVFKKAAVATLLVAAASSTLSTSSFSATGDMSRPPSGRRPPKTSVAPAQAPASTPAFHLCRVDETPTGCVNGKTCRPKLAFDLKLDAALSCNYSKINNICKNYQPEYCCMTTCVEFYPDKKATFAKCVSDCQSG